jgi:AbrB family looped-hinge helix DNA binding protein
VSEGASKIAESRLTGQGQISVPAEVRRRLGIGPGSVIEWDDDGDRITVRRAGGVSSAQVHEAVFRYAPKARTLDELKAGVKARMRRKHARR